MQKRRKIRILSQMQNLEPRTLLTALLSYSTDPAYGLKSIEYNSIKIVDNAPATNQRPSPSSARLADGTFAWTEAYITGTGLISGHTDRWYFEANIPNNIDPNLSGKIRYEYRYEQGSTSDYEFLKTIVTVKNISTNNVDIYDHSFRTHTYIDTLTQSPTNIDDYAFSAGNNNKLFERVGLTYTDSSINNGTQSGQIYSMLETNSSGSKNAFLQHQSSSLRIFNFIGSESLSYETMTASEILSQNESETFVHVLKFSPTPKSSSVVAASELEAYKNKYPNLLTENSTDHDRRLISMVTLTGASKTSDNPRGWDSTTRGTADLSTSAGYDLFYTNAVTRITDLVRYTHQSNGQGVVIWDIEGGELSSLYYGNPDLFGETAADSSFVPEMYHVKSGETLPLYKKLFKIITDSGLKAGLTIRPQELDYQSSPRQLNVTTSESSITTVADTVDSLSQKILWAYSNLGVKIFYIDSTNANYTSSLVQIQENLKDDVPGLILLPENALSGSYRAANRYEQFVDGSVLNLVPDSVRTAYQGAGAYLRASAAEYTTSIGSYSGSQVEDLLVQEIKYGSGLIVEFGVNQPSAARYQKAYGNINVGTTNPVAGYDFTIQLSDGVSNRADGVRRTMINSFWRIDWQGTGNWQLYENDLGQFAPTSATHMFSKQGTYTINARFYHRKYGSVLDSGTTLQQFYDNTNNYRLTTATVTVASPSWLTADISSGDDYAFSKVDVTTNPSTFKTQLDILDGSVDLSSVGIINDLKVVGSGDSVTNFTGTVFLNSVTLNNTARFDFISNGNRTLKVNSLSLASGTVLDLNNNDLIVDYTGTSVYQTLVDHLLAGRLDVDDSATYLGTNYNTNLALAEFDDTGFANFNGWSADSSTIIGKYTWSGDVNFDGLVDVYELSTIDDNFGTSGTRIQGDLNYDGSVDAFDYSPYSATVGAGVGAPLLIAPPPSSDSRYEIKADKSKLTSPTRFGKTLLATFQDDSLLTGSAKVRKGLFA